MFSQANIDTLAALLPPLVYTFWILASSAAIVALIPLPFADSFRAAVLLSACRGKLMDMRPLNALGPLSDLTVPQKWFWHFYAIGAITNALIILILSSSLGYTTILDNAATAAAGGRGSMPIAILVLWQVHLIRRLIETIALLKYPPNARMHIIAYVFALAYYVVVSMTLLPPTAVEKLAAFVFRGQSATVFTSGISSGTIGKVKQLTAAAVLYHFSLMRRLGIAVFVAGSLIQLHSHILLRQLADKNPSTRRSSAVTTPRRKTRSSSGGALEQEMKTESGSGGSKQQYKIPKGGMFELVSCPHYFGEIVIYVGLVLVTEMHNWGAWLMLAWVVANLLLAGNLTHTWYKSHFKTYPKHRKAIIPYIY